MSGRITTTVVPAANSDAIVSAATTAVPEDGPTWIPSSRVIRRAIRNASRSETRT